MKPFVQTTLILMATAPLLAYATPEQDNDFAARCSSPSVVRCVGFDNANDAPMPPPGDYAFAPAPFGVYPGPYVPPALDATNAASGNSSLKFTIPSNSGADAGSYFVNFSDDFSVQFGEGSPHGKEFYVQWRQKFSREYLDTHFDEGEGWKQIIIGEGDRADENIYSCTDITIVVTNQSQRRFPQVYHSCGQKDDQYEPLNQPTNGSVDFLLQNAMPDPYCLYSVSGGANAESNNCRFYERDQWMTFQVHVIIGTPYTSNGVYKHDSTIQLWVASEGQPSTLVLDYSPKDAACQAIQTSQPSCQTGYDLFNNDPLVKQYGQVWLLPYHTRKSSTQAHPEAYTWYDELIISTSRIQDPGVTGDTLAPAAPSGIDVQ